MTLLGRVAVRLLVVAAPVWGCGAKGPPLAPLVITPRPVAELTVRRLGGEVYVSFALPTENRDGSEPADLVRVDVYAMTTQPRVLPDRMLDLEEFEEAATLVRSIEVRPRETPPAATTADPAGEAPVDPRFEQGSLVVIVETLSAEILVPVDPWEDERDDADGEEEDDDETPETPLIAPLMTPLLPGPLQREYVVVGVSNNGNEVDAARRIAVPLVAPPVPPSVFTVTYTEDVIDITWELPPRVRATVQAPATSTGGSVTGGPAAATSPRSVTGAPAAAVLSVATPADPAGNTGAGQTATGRPATTPALPLPSSRPLVEGPPASSVLPSRPIFGGPPAPPILESRPIIEWPPASRYDLYEIVDVQDGSTVMPSPLNTMPLATPAYADRRVELGIERCYAVSTLDVVGGFDMRSRLSDKTCVTLIDVFPPAAPEGLRAVGTDGAVGLIWQSNDEEDLAGYLVLRGVPPGETLLPLTPEPVPENTYRDTTAEPGVRYVYAVRAVDMVTPPNVSPLSNLEERAAR